ncbi:protein kinase [Nonomuraea sp. NPDC059194]|uniref:protein kinase domain-containing protein n=1 Tax=Nonomuraea sp. NPDC059194 TaxID=3346764 RepID=UPI0036B85DA1
MGAGLVPGYREVRQLGAGRTGRVFLATYESTGAYVAIKYLNATLRRDAEFMERFRAETPGLVEIDDPNVVRFYEYVETPTRTAAVMELVDGVSMRAILAEHRRTSPEAALAVLKGTLLGLAAAHERGIAHRDVKPENVLVQADGASKLADFGLAVHVEEPGVPAGSPPYMAPELWTKGTAGVLADLYAAACVLFESITGRQPYRAPDVAALRDKHLAEQVPVEVVPEAVRDLLRRGLAKEPASRPRSAREFAAELEQAAVAGFGAEWEQRGRRHLGELATLLALRYPLADPGSPQETPARGSLVREWRVPRLPPHLWIAGGALAATLIALLISGGRLPPGPGAFLAPPPKSPFELGATPVDSKPTTRKAAPKPAVSRTGAVSSRPSRSSATPPPPTPPPSQPSRSASASPPAPPTSAPPRAGALSPAVKSADIVAWSGSAGTVKVAAEGTGPVRLRVSYTRREGDGPARTVHEAVQELTGRTAYTVPLSRAPGQVACGKRVYLGLIVQTERAAANGPQISEAPVDGPPCEPSPTRSSPTATSPTRTSSPSTAPTGLAPTGFASTGPAPTTAPATAASPTGLAPTGMAPTGVAPSASSTTAGITPPEAIPDPASTPHTPQVTPEPPPLEAAPADDS